MSFNRAIYDPCEYNTRLAESNNVLTYNLEPSKFYNCNDCRVGLGVVGGNNVSLTGCNLVDLESELRNQTRLYSSCPQYKYLPSCTRSGNGASCGCKTGLPCGSRKCQAKVNHLRSCNLVHYKPRITTVGYKLDYPDCSQASSLCHVPGRKM